MIFYYNQTPCFFLIVSALRNCNSFSAFELIISYILYTFCINFHHKSDVNKDSLDTYFTLNLNWPTKKCSRKECHRGCEHEPQALFLSSSFHPRLHVSFCIDEFIIGFKRMISIHFKQITEKHNTRLGFKCLIDSKSAYELSGPPGQGLSWFL